MTRSDGSAYPPSPAEGERAAVAREMVRESDELPWLSDDGPEPDLAAPRREVYLHVHQLCGHDCLSGACTTLEAICISCEFALQDDRAPNKSHGMNPKPSV